MNMHMSDPIVILGMHRSGTSFLVRTLNLAGLWLGDDDRLHTIEGRVEGRAKVGNPKGNYENAEGIAINNAILARSGGAWYNPPKRLITTADDPARITALRASLASGLPEGYLRWGWKDPRTVLTLNIWIDALKSNVFIVGAYRHPSAVANSLLKRDGIPLEIGYALWGIYVRHLIHHVAKHPSVLVRFDVDSGSLIEQVAHVCRCTGLRADISIISSWFDQSLVRNSTPVEDTTPMFRSVAPLWDELESLRKRGH